MAQELTLARALRSKRDGPNPYATIVFTFLLTVLQHPDGHLMEMEMLDARNSPSKASSNNGM